MRRASAARLTPTEYYDDNVTAWAPGVNKAAQAKGAQSVVFFNKSKLDPALSKEEGRPRYQKVPYIRVTSPGDRDNIIMRQAWIVEGGAEESEMADNVRFPEDWARFLSELKGEEASGPTGTPLEAWPALSNEQVAELRHFNIETIEQLAEMTDSNVMRFMGIRALQRLARDYLEAAKDGSVVTRLHGELEDLKSRSDAQAKQLADNAETIRQLREMMEAQQRGREQAPAPATPAEGDAGEVLDPSREKNPEKPKVGSFLRPKAKAT